jgi:hypothetical protein
MATVKTLQCGASAAPLECVSYVRFLKKYFFGEKLISQYHNAGVSIDTPSNPGRVPSPS